MRYHFDIHRDPDGLWAQCRELRGCMTVGENEEELQANMHEVLNGYLEERPESNVMFPLPDESIQDSEDVVSIQVAPPVAIAMMLRQTRLEHHMTQVEVQKAMGFAHKNSYIRLERRANPRADILSKVLKVFPDFPLKECLT